MAGGAIDFNSLRMSNLYGGGNPLGINPIPQSPDIVSDYLTRIRPIIQGDQRHDLAVNESIRNMHRQQAQMDADNAAQHPNVRVEPDLNASQKANLQLNQSKLDEKTQNDQAKLASQNSNQTQNNAIREGRAKAYEFKATHPNMIFKDVKGGNITAFDPVTGKSIDTDIPSGSLTDQEKMDLQFDHSSSLEDQKQQGRENIQTMRGKQSMDQIGARGDIQFNNQSSLEDQRAQDRENIQTMRGSQAIGQINARGDQSRQTNAEKPSNTKTATPGQQRTTYANNAARLMNDPAYSKYITRGKTANEFTIDPNTPQDIYHDINQRIYGDSGDSSRKDKTLAPDDKSKKELPDPAGIR